LGKEIFSLKIHLEYGGTFTKLFMHASSRTRYDYNLTIMKSPKPATDNSLNEHFAL
jgi:hypothetical protein